MVMRALILLGILGLLLIPLPVRAADTAIVSFPSNSATAFFFLDGAYPVNCGNFCGWAMSFTTSGSDWFLTRVTWKLDRDGTMPSGTIEAHLYNADVQTLGSAKPDGTTAIVESDDMLLTDLALTETSYNFNFTGTTKLAANKIYTVAGVILNSTNFSGGTQVNVDADTLGTSYAGVPSRFQTGAWATTTNDISVFVYGIATPSSSLRDGAYFLALLMSGLTVITAINVFQSPKEKFGKVKVKAVLVLAVITFIMFLFSRLF